MAVYTPVGDAELAAFLGLYDLPPLQSAEGILQGVENTNYRLFFAEGLCLILTLFERRTPAADLPFFFAFADHLAAAGVPAPRLVLNRAGVGIGHLCARPAAVVECLAGADVAAGAITPAHCAAVGAVAARMHRAAESFPQRRDNPLSLTGWRDLATRIGAGADTVQTGLSAMIAAQLDDVQGRWPSDLPAGVVHADLFPDNVLFDGVDIGGVIDFYFACSDFFAYDLAIILNAWCFDDAAGRMCDGRAAALLSAYQAVRPLNMAEQGAFSTLCRGAALRFLLTRLHDLLFHPPDAVVQPKDPIDYVRRLEWHCTHDILNR